MTSESEHHEPHEDSRQEQKSESQDNQPARRQRPRPPVRASTTASVLGSMEGEPETVQRMDHVMDQLDDKGKDELKVLASRVATGAKRKGRIDQADKYLAQNPWHDQEKEEPVFSLASPLPRRDDGSGERKPTPAQEKEKPVFSLGEPLPRTVRKRNHPEAVAEKQAQEDVEQGLRRRPTRDGQEDAATPESDRTERTLQDNRRPGSHLGDQDQGTDSE